MLALGSSQEVLERQIAAGKVDFDIAGFLENVVLADIANPGKRKPPENPPDPDRFNGFVFSVPLPVRTLPLDRK